MKITVCIGSACHLKGSRQVLETLQYLVKEAGLNSKVLIRGAFCMGNCQEGVCVSIDDKIFSVMPENVEKFFTENILNEV